MLSVCFGCEGEETCVDSQADCMAYGNVFTVESLVGRS